MAIVSIGQTTVNFTIAQASVEYIAPATARPKILELTMYVATPNQAASSFGFGRPHDIGLIPQGTPLQAEDPLDVPLTKAALQWGTSPTAPNVFSRRWNCSNQLGVFVAWTWPRGFVLVAAGSAVIWNITGASRLFTSCVVDE